jgi:rod shape-determining protein MreB
VQLLAGLVKTWPPPPPVRPLVVACRPVLSSPDDQEAIRRVMTAAFAPARVLLIDTVRAAAMSAGLASGALLILDVGAELTEAAVLIDGRVATARRVEVGTHDFDRHDLPQRLARVIYRSVGDLRHDADHGGLMAAALNRGPVIVGDGATRPALIQRITEYLKVPARSAPTPRLGGLRGAGLAARAVLRHPANGTP